MSPAEVDGFLLQQRICWVGTVRPGRAPHVTPLWFVWDGASIWLNSVVTSQRWADVAQFPEVSVARGRRRGVLGAPRGGDDRPGRDAR